MRIEAYDTANPSQRASEDVLIDVVRNPNAPIFTNNFYIETIPETQPLGSSILRVSANDADGDTIYYEIESTVQGQSASQYFFLSSGTGEIYVWRSLSGTQIDTYTFTVRARDRSYPEKFSTSTVQINVQRDRFTPVCASNNVATIPETTVVNASLPVITVVATDNDLQVSSSLAKQFWLKE